MASQPGLIPLTYHVDYWDYLGWKDTLAKADFSQRQYDYAHARGDMDVYTPQAIVQGATHHIGSGVAAIEKAVEGAASSTGQWVEPSLSVKGNEVLVSLPASSGVAESTVWLASIVPEKSVTIERGENAGSQLVYTNVVRALLPAGMWHGEATQLKLPASSVLLYDCRRCVALVQVGKVGPIIGAAAISVTV